MSKQTISCSRAHRNRGPIASSRTTPLTDISHGTVRADVDSRSKAPSRILPQQVPTFSICTQSLFCTAYHGGHENRYPGLCVHKAQPQFRHGPMSVQISCGGTVPDPTTVSRFVCELSSWYCTVQFDLSLVNNSTQSDFRTLRRISRQQLQEFHVCFRTKIVLVFIRRCI